MTPLNVTNVMSILATTFQITNITPIRSIHLWKSKFIMKLLIFLNNFQNTIVSVEHDYVLDFANLSKSYGPRIVKYITTIEDKIAILNFKNALLIMKGRKSTSIIREICEVLEKRKNSLIFK